MVPCGAQTQKIAFLAMNRSPACEFFIFDPETRTMTKNIPLQCRAPLLKLSDDDDYSYRLLAVNETTLIVIYGESYGCRALYQVIDIAKNQFYDRWLPRHPFIHDLDNAPLIVINSHLVTFGGVRSESVSVKTMPENKRHFFDIF